MLRNRAVLIKRVIRTRDEKPEVRTCATFVHARFCIGADPRRVHFQKREIFRCCQAAAARSVLFFFAFCSGSLLLITRLSLFSSLFIIFLAMAVSHELASSAYLIFPELVCDMSRTCVRLRGWEIRRLTFRLPKTWVVALFSPSPETTQKFTTALLERLFSLV